MPADYAKLTKLCDGKQILNIRQTAGSMFDFFKPGEAGIYLKEDRKVKASKKEFEELYGQMSLDNYQKKINVITYNYFLSLFIYSKMDNLSAV